MGKSVSWKEYAVSALLVFAVLVAMFMIKLFVIPAPDDLPALEIYMKSLVYCAVGGIVVSAVLLLVKKPILLAIVAGASIIASLFFYDHMFTAVFAFAAICFLGSIPFVAAFLAKMRRKV